MKKLDRFFEVYNEEKQKNKKIFNFPYILCSVGKTISKKNRGERFYLQ